jgi:DNA-binding MarR family transcriptional regulator
MSAKTRTQVREASVREATELLTLLSGVMIGLKKRPSEKDPKHQELHQAFEKSELGERHIAPLIALALGGPASVSELAGRIGLTPATTSLLVGELSRAGLVERREDEADRRRTIVSIDESIQEAVQPSLDEILMPLARGLERMSPAQRAHLLDGLRVVNEEIRGADGNGSG